MTKLTSIVEYVSFNENRKLRDFDYGQNSHIMVVTIASDEYKGRSSTASIV